MCAFILEVNSFVSSYSERVMARQMINWPRLSSLCMNKIQLLPCLVYVGHFITADKAYMEKPAKKGQQQYKGLQYNLLQYHIGIIRPISMRDI